LDRRRRPTPWKKIFVYFFKTLWFRQNQRYHRENLTTTRATHADSNATTTAPKCWTPTRGGSKVQSGTPGRGRGVSMKFRPLFFFQTSRKSPVSSQKKFGGPGVTGTPQAAGGPWCSYFEISQKSLKKPVFGTFHTPTARPRGNF